MDNIVIPTIAKQVYNQSLSGYYGEIGMTPYGVRFLQAAVPISQIDKLTLVSEMPDSERWPVRQLFQRDIDHQRVEEDIMPYFTAADKIKFFNPLTIVLLPLSDGGKVLKSVSETRSTDSAWAQGESADVVEAAGFYRLRHLPNSHEFSQIEWNADKVKLVAVDGQHRLSALKRLKAQQARDAEDPSLLAVHFERWTIPIVLLVFPARPEAKTGNDRNYLLENMRDIFVTINTNAQKPNRCRTILLSDYSVSAMCCQEMLDYCHSAGASVLPLLFFDWRAHNDGSVPENPAAYMRVEDLEDLHVKYLIGEDGDNDVITQEQRERLFIDDMSETLDEGDAAVAREQIRKRYREVLMPAAVKVLVSFTPFRTYVEHLKSIQAQCVTDIQKHAFSYLAYGLHQGQAIYNQQIVTEAKALADECETRRASLPLLFQQLIGFRGVFCGLDLAVEVYNGALNKIAEWNELVEWYVVAMNKMYDQQMFDKDSELLRHICFDPSGVDKIVNYRLEEQRKALGVYCVLAACAFDKKPHRFRDQILELIDTLDGTRLRGYQRQVRPQLKDAHPTMEAKELAELIKKEANKLTARHLKKLKAKLEIAD